MAGWNEWVTGANMTLSEVLDAFKRARIGLDVHDKFYWTALKIIELAIKEGNANFDVEMAKGVYNTLKERLDAGDNNTNDLKIKINDDLSDDNILRLIHSVVSAGDEIFTPVGLEQFMTAQNGAWAI